MLNAPIKPTKLPADYPTLYHISFRSDLQGVWQPKLPAGSVTTGESSLFTEPMVPRISTAPTIEGCFAAIFENVYKLFEEKNYPYMYFSVYSPVVKGGELVWSNADATRTRALWDAHYTGEVSFVQPVEMRLVGEVKIWNTNKIPTKMVHPFNDPTLKEESVGPAPIKFEWTKRN